MCGVWVALEDIGEDQGPLIYYPGSHKWPIYTNEYVGKREPNLIGQEAYYQLWYELIRVHGAKPQLFHAKKGQALIWAANLLHGGSRQKEPSLTRWSQVTHYFFEKCAYYTPMESDPFFGNIAFRRLTDMRSGEAVPNIYIDQPIDENFITLMTAGATTGLRNTELNRMLDGLRRQLPAPLRAILRNLRNSIRRGQD